jgi:hypothetical protein
MPLDRSKLPQIPKGLIPKFIRFCRDNGVGAKGVGVDADTLKPIQSHINRDKVESMKKNMQGINEQPLMVSNDGYVLDGHHRWVAMKELDPTGKVFVIRFDCPIAELLKLGHTFDGSFTKSVRENTTYKQLAKMLWLK